MKFISIITLALFLNSVVIGQSVPSTSAAQPQPVESNFSTYFAKRKSFVDKDTKQISEAEQIELDKIVTSASEIDQDSYQYNYMEYINRGRTIDAFEYLEKAEAAYPNNAELYDDFVYHYELTGNENQKTVYCKKLMESNTIPDAIMEYNYNVLMSLDKNAVLLTNGSDDTFPIFIWQTIKNIRKDVTVINLDMLNEKTYIDHKASAGNLKIKQQNSTIQTMSYILENNSGKKIYVGHTVSQKILKKYKDKFYLSGLTYQYSPTPVENVTIAVQRFEEDFKLSELNQSQENSKVNNLNFNYILPLITFIEYYKSSGEQDKFERTRELALKLARRVGKEAYILDYLTKKGL
ncbi:MAG: hypothetical protein H6598_03755 [Flavobacteriales bacterium]|nr:hypothetical protein [Flavobacteriales bacterium]